MAPRNEGPKQTSLTNAPANSPAPKSVPDHGTPKTVNLADIHTDKPGLDPKQLLDFSKWILLVLAALVSGAAAANILMHSAESKETWDFAKTVLPPVATLIIGFYYRDRR